MQCSQFSNEQLPLSNRQAILEKHRQRIANHPQSERAKHPKGTKVSLPNLQPGDLVYLYSDRDKGRARDRYIVTRVDQEWCFIQKFTGMQLRSTSYKVKLSECYKVPQTLPKSSQPNQSGSLSDDEDEFPVNPPIPAPIPAPPNLLLPPDAPAEDPPPTSCVPTSIEPSHVPSPLHLPPGDPSVPQRPTRSRKPPVRFKDYVLPH